MRTCFMLVVFASIPISWLGAQTPNARLLGDVHDASGAGVPGASIQVKNNGTNEVRTAKTNAQGEYVIPNLQPGIDYEVEVSAAGFRRTKESGVELQVDQTARLDFKLDIGAVSESVEVSASRIPLLNTENAVKGDVVINQEMASMPLDGRNFLDLGLLMPNVVEKTEGTWQGSTMAVNGARPDNTNFVVDGFNDQGQRGGQPQASPPLDAMMEFKVETSGYSAEFGRLAGGVVSMVLKTGANRFHGALFEFLRNDKLDARNFFSGDTLALRRNQFGATLSGPVWIPKLYQGRDRTFFLFSWESYRQAQGDVSLMRVPTDLERSGDFSQTLNASGKPLALIDPFAATSSSFPGNRIPASRFSPPAAILRNLFPSPNLSGANNYREYATDTEAWDSFLYKIDHRFNPKDATSFRFTNRPDTTHSPYDGSPLGLWGYHDVVTAMLGGATYTRVFSPTVINEFRAGFSRNFETSKTDDAGANMAAALGIPGTTTNPSLMGMPRVAITNLPALGDAQLPPHDIAVNTVEVGNTVTLVRSHHTLKFGGTLLYGQTFQVNNSNVRGLMSFSGNFTGAPLADFLLGVLQSSSRSTAPVPLYILTKHVGTFIQDDFRVRPNLTLNLGLRYEYVSPLREKYDRIASFMPELGKLIIADDRALPNLQAQISSAGLSGMVGLARDYGLPRSLAYANTKDFAPRFGFAWRPGQNNRIAIRGGYGIFYGNSANDPIRLDLADVFPFVANETYNSSAKNPSQLTLANPFPEAFAKISGINNAAGEQVHPSPQYLQSWNLTVERELTKATAVEMAYAGSKGTDLASIISINTPDRKPELMLANGSFPRPYPQWSTVQMYLNNSNSSYNAGLLTFRRRFVNNFFLRANYTFSKSLDSSSQIKGTGSGGGSNLDPRNRRLDRGRSAWDARHVFTTTFSYQVPARYGRYFGRWQVAGSGRMASGRPITPTDSSASVANGVGNRPDRISSGALDNPTPDHWFDVTAFPLVPSTALRFGTSGRNILDGPDLIALNFAVMKNFRLRETGTLQFRVETFNATNHTNFMLPDRNVNAVTGGAIGSAGPARVFQVAMRYDF